MSSKYDQLSGRLADRLTAAPARGRAVVRESDEPPPPASRSTTQRAPRRANRPRPAASTEPTGSVRRGHQVPDDLHRRARRRKVVEAVDRKLTWSDLMTDAVTMLVEHPDLQAVLEPSARQDGPTRLVQVTLPAELDRRFRICYLDLNDRSGRRVTYEQLWAAAIEVWLDR